MPPDLLKAVHLSEGTQHPVIIASGNPWCASYTMLVNDDLYEDHDPEFLINDWIVSGYIAAKRARFEFGETPEYAGNLFERMIA